MHVLYVLETKSGANRFELSTDGQFRQVRCQWSPDDQRTKEVSAVGLHYFLLVS